MIQNDVGQIIHRQQKRVESLAQQPRVARRARLLQMKAMLRSSEPAILAAAARDLGKSEVEAFTSEIAPVLQEIDYQLKHLRKHEKPQRRRVGSLTGPAKAEILRRPFGSVLILGPWNYPVNLTLLPMVGAMAAGNSCVIKPSEFAPACSQVLADSIRQHFEPDDAWVIQGDAKVAKTLLQEPWNYIFFTGSPAIGEKVYRAAARQLIPVTLELGGKNPCIVLADSANLTTARRIVWGKFMNCGQTCVAPDYLLIPESCFEPFVEKLKQAIVSFYGTDPIHSPDYGKIIHERHLARLENFLKQGTVLFGGETDTKACRMAPALLSDMPEESEVMREEIFGPILPIRTYRDLSQVTRDLKTKAPSLACYAFGQDKNAMRRLRSDIPCACFSQNHVIRHVASPKLPFGGIGRSGLGRYHGSASYQTFTHAKVFYRHAAWYDLKAQYPPYTTARHRFIRGWFKWLL